jgi:chromosome segregation ATPase
MKWLDKLIEKRVDKIKEEIYQIEERRDNYQGELNSIKREVELNGNYEDYLNYMKYLNDTVDCIQEEIEKKKGKIRFINQLFFIKGKSND